VDYSTLTCPSCNHFEASPQLAIEKNRHDVFIKNAFDAEPHLEKLWLPFLVWTCPGCNKRFGLLGCVMCGRFGLSPEFIDAEGKSQGWVCECSNCVRRFQAN